MLEHVHREQVVLAERVDRRDEPRERHGEPEREERRAPPRREIGAPAATQPQPALREEHGDERRDGEHDGRRRPGGVREHQRTRH